MAILQDRAWHRAFAQDAGPLSNEFIGHDLRATFLADLNADIVSVQEAIHDHTAAKDTHIAARAAIDAAMEAGLTEVRRLDAIVKNRLRDDPAAVSVWRSARHVERGPRGKSVTPPQAPTPSPAPAPTSGTIAAGKQASSSKTRGPPLRHPTPDSTLARQFSVCRVRGVLHTVVCANGPTRFD
jgi:hypothetical protein